MKICNATNCTPLNKVCGNADICLKRYMPDSNETDVPQVSGGGKGKFE